MIPVACNLDTVILERSIARSIIASKMPMSVDPFNLNDKVTDMVNRLALHKPGTAHNNFLCGITVRFWLTFSKLGWGEWERYHFQDIVSSQSTMHRICRFDIEAQCNEYVTQKTIDHVTELIQMYNENPSDTNYKVVLYNAPLGLRLTADVQTNYLQLKTMYQQRKKHRLDEWQELCEWMKTLPYSEWITGEDE